MLRLAVRVRRERAEIVLAELLELAPAGVEEVEVGDEVVEYAVYGALGELPALPDLTAAAGPALVEIHTSEVADDWSERWREFHQPLVLKDTLTIRPPWAPASSTRLDVVIDPGRAFGTGGHGTTRLCLELMLALEAAGSLLDLGCGSGVLAIAAAKLGWEPVTAVDYDQASVEATLANAARNGVELEVLRRDMRADTIPRAQTIVANLLGPLLLAWAERLAHGGWRPECVIASGLLVEEADQVALAFAAAGLSEVQRQSHREWAALLLRRSSPRVDNAARPNPGHAAGDLSL